MSTTENPEQVAWLDKYHDLTARVAAALAHEEAWAVAAARSKVEHDAATATVDQWKRELEAHEAVKPEGL